MYFLGVNMMRLHHIAANVRDLEKIKAFYQAYFGAKANERYYNPKTGLKTYFLTFASGSQLEIMTRPDLAAIPGDAEHFGYVHLAFGVGDESSVDHLTDRLRKDGYRVYSEPRRTGDGYYESCVLDPDGNRIEIIANP